MSYPHHPHSGPAGAPNMAANFNAMLQRSAQEHRPQDAPAEAPGKVSLTIGKHWGAPRSIDIMTDLPQAGYSGVYNPPPQPGSFSQQAQQAQQAQRTQQKNLGGGRPPQPTNVLPFDLPPQAFLTSAMLLDMVDSPYTYRNERPR